MKPLFTRYQWVVQSVLILVGLAVLLISGIDLIVPRGSAAAVLLSSSGITIITTVLLTMLYSALGVDAASVIEEKLQFQRRVADMGLVQVQVGVPDEWLFERVSDATTVDMLFNTGKNASFRYSQRLEHAIVNRGCRVRLLVINPENPILTNDQVTAALCPGTDIRGEVRSVVSTLQLVKERLERRSPRLSRGSLEVRQYNFAPTGSLVIVNGDSARHTPYLPYSHSSEVPVYDIVRKPAAGLLDLFQKTFEEAWQRSDAVLKIEFD